MAKLIIQEGKNAGQEFELRERRLILGSGPDSQLVLTGPGVEAIHASLEDRGDRWVLQDLGGPGGTAVNGVPVDGPHRLAEGEVIELGAVKLEIRGIGPQRPEATELPAGASVIPAPSGQTRGRKGFPFLAIIGGGVLAMVAVVAIIVGLSSGVWLYRPSAPPERPANAGPAAIPEPDRTETGPAAPVVVEQPTPVLILLQPRSPEITIPAGQELVIRSRAKDQTGIERVELWVDGRPMATSLAGDEQTTDFLAEHRWSFAEIGSYRLDVIAYNRAELPSNTGSFLVTIVTPAAQGVSPLATPTPGAAALSGDLPFIDFFGCSPACTTEKGASLQLEWRVRKARQVFLGDNEVELAGQTRITPTTTVTVELRALNGSGVVTETLQITVE